MYRLLSTTALSVVLLLGIQNRAQALCTCSSSSLHKYMSPDRVYDVRAFMDAECSGTNCTTAAVHAILDHDPDGGTGPATAAAARTLYFSNGADFVVDTMISVDVDGVAFRGETGFDYPGAATDETGPRFSCAIGSGQSCIRVTADGFVFERLAMTWSGLSGSAPGIYFWHANQAVLRDVLFEDYPGFSVMFYGACESPLIEDVHFLASDPSSNYALYFYGQTGGIGSDGVRPKRAMLRRIIVDGYDWGVRVYGGVDVTVADSQFLDQDHNALWLSSALHAKVRACSFQSRTLDGVTAAIRVDEPSALAAHAPDVVVTDSIFDLGCRIGRKAVDLVLSQQSNQGRARVAFIGNTIKDSAHIGSGMPFELADFTYATWQCAGNRVVTQTGTGPETHDTYLFDRLECETPGPTGGWAHPATCITP